MKVNGVFLTVYELNSFILPVNILGIKLSFPEFRLFSYYQLYAMTNMNTKYNKRF